MINVQQLSEALKDQGFLEAKGDDVADDHEALQRLIDPSTIPSDERNPPGSDPPPQPGALYFPKGVYRITETLVFPPKTGYHLIGGGLVEEGNSANQAVRSVILWDAPTSSSSSSSGETKSMIRYGGTGLIWNGLTLWGRRFSTETTNPNPRADIGIEITKPAGGSLDPGKMWFPSIMIEDCATAIYADGSSSADSCAFGLIRVRRCDVGFRLDGAGATMFTFRFVHPQSNEDDPSTIFDVTGGGRIYVAAMKVLSPNVTVLDVAGSDMANSFYHIGGMKTDAQATGMKLLQNNDSGDGTVYVRFTDAHFVGGNVSATIDRSSSTSGQTALELVGCKDLGVLENNVTIKGPSASNKSRVIVRDSELNNVTALIIPAAAGGSSQHYTDNRLRNWLFGQGVQVNSSASG